MPGDDAGTNDDAAGDGASVGVGGVEVSRRKALVGGAGVLLGAVAGAGATVATSGPSQIEKQRPNDDGTGSLGELRWILEEQHQLAVTSMVRDEDTVRVAYETNAQSRGESRQEIGAVISAYGLIVANDGPTERLAADIEGRFEGQSTAYHVQAEWVKQWRSGELSDAVVAQRVFNTRQFPEDADSN